MVWRVSLSIFVRAFGASKTACQNIGSAVGKNALRSPADIRTNWALSSERIAAAAASVLSIAGGLNFARRSAILAFAFSAVFFTRTSSCAFFGDEVLNLAPFAQRAQV